MTNQYWMSITVIYNFGSFSVQSCRWTIWICIHWIMTGATWPRRPFKRTGSIDYPGIMTHDFRYEAATISYVGVTKHQHESECCSLDAAASVHCRCHHWLSLLLQIWNHWPRFLPNRQYTEPMPSASGINTETTTLQPQVNTATAATAALALTSFRANHAASKQLLIL